MADAEGVPRLAVLRDVDELMAKLTPSEKAQLLQRVARELSDAVARIQSSPDVCGGEACVASTRIPVWVLEHARRLGTTEAQLLTAYPALKAEDLANAWAYVRAHRDQIEQSIAENEAA